MIEVKKDNLSSLSKKETKKLKSLTIQSGYMRLYLSCILNALQEGKDDFVAEVYIARERNFIIGWGIIQDLLYRNPPYAEVDLFVDEKYRNRGVGSMILSAIKSDEWSNPLSLWVTKKEPSFYLYKKFNNDPFVLFDMDYYNENKQFKIFDA